jgi:hypothetical protein
MTDITNPDLLGLTIIYLLFRLAIATGIGITVGLSFGGIAALFKRPATDTTGEFVWTTIGAVVTVIIIYAGSALLHDPTLTGLSQEKLIPDVIGAVIGGLVWNVKRRVTAKS